MDLSWSHGINNMRSLCLRYICAKCCVCFYLEPMLFRIMPFAKNLFHFAIQFQWKRLMHVWTLPLLSFGLSGTVSQIIGVPFETIGDKKKNVAATKDCWPSSKMCAPVLFFFFFSLVWLFGFKASHTLACVLDISKPSNMRNDAVV